MHLTRRKTFKLLGLAAGPAALAGLAAPAQAHGGRDDDDDDDGLRSGGVFVITNAADGNELLVYGRVRGGGLALQMRAPTGGLGSGAGLGSQGAVTLSGDGRWIFVVNARSNTLSTFAIERRELRLVSVVDSLGLHPNSTTERDGLVYVLNDMGAGNVAGFRNRRGRLEPIPGSVRGLSAAGGTMAAQVGFSDDGDALVVTERATQRLTSWRVLGHGGLGAAVVTPSSGMTPFGFAFNRRNRLIVSEAFGGAAGGSAVSSYRFDDAAPARPVAVSASVPTMQTAACWVAVTPDGRHAYAVNAGSNSVSSYRIARDGTLTLLQAVAGDTGPDSGPTDAAITPDGRRLYVRSGRSLAISAFRIDGDGALSPLPGATGLPPVTAGLAAN